MFSFAHTEYLLFLLLLVPVGLLFFFNLRWKKKMRQRLGDPVLVQALTAGHSARRFSFRFWLFAAALVCTVLGAANLRRSGEVETTSRKGRDVVIALDVSKSMLAGDVLPSRLEKSKQFTGKLISRLPDERIGLVWFAGKAYLPMPLTADEGAARLFLQAATPDAVPTQGTVLAEALRLSARSFPEDSKRYKIVLLITDGEDHDEQAEEAARELKEQGILLLVIGIGSARGAPITEPGSTDFKKDLEGQTVISKLNEPLLKKMAAVNGGMYGNLQDTDGMVKDVITVIQQLDKKAAVEAGLPTRYIHLFPWLLAAALLLLLAELFISERQKKMK